MTDRLKSVPSASLIWLLEVDFAGMLFRFSTEPIELTKNDGSAAPFNGGLDDPGYIETLSRFDHSIDQQVISVSIDFGIDVAKTIQKGHFLAGSAAELSCVLVQNGVVQQAYEDRNKILSGFVNSPRYAFPDQPVGVVDLSVEASPAEDGGTIIRAEQSVANGTTWAGITIHNGKPYPIVFGTPGYFKTGDGTADDCPASPGYIASYDTTHKRALKVVIAGHHVNAQSVWAYGEDNTKVEHAVTNGSDLLGSPVAYIEPTAASDFYLNTEYWISWRPTSGSSYGGGLKNPFSTSQELTGAGDVIRYILRYSTLDVDYGKFAAVSDYLNQFKMSGYISDPETSPWEWVSSIAQGLPITFRNGPNGIYPIVHDVRAPASHGFAVSAGFEFQRDGPVQVEVGLAEIYNSISLGYAYDARENSPMRYGVTGTKKSGALSSFSTSTTESSILRYGARWRRIENAYVYERSTAQHIIRYISDTEALPPRSIQYRASPRFAFLSLGDIVSLTDDDLSLSSQACFVSSRQWDVDSWIFTLTIDTIPDRDDNSF